MERIQYREYRGSDGTPVYVTKYGGTKVSITCTGYLVNRMVAHIIWTAQDFNFYFTPL